MAIDFSFPPEVEEIRVRVRDFVRDVVKPEEDRIQSEELEKHDRDAYVSALINLREQAHAAGLWLPHMPEEWGGMGLGHVELAMVQAESARSYYGPWVLNCQAPDEGNMHTLLHWATDEQKENYLRPLCEGTTWSCFAMTEPEVAGSDPTLIQTQGYEDGDEWVINGHKWFISNAHRAELRHPHRPHRGRPRPAAGRQHGVHRRHPAGRLERGPPDRDHARLDRPLRDPHRGPARPQGPDAGRPGPGPPARPVPAGPGPPGALHALDRPGRDGARHDGRPVARTASPTDRSWPRSRASSG